MKYLSLILLFVLSFALSAQAQQGSGGKAVAEIIASSSTQVVKGAPFSAEAVSESVQTLSDGNKITRSYTTKMFRDSDGRFRREGGGGIAVGGGSSVFSYTYSTGGSQDMISIYDPVAKQRYFLNPNDKTARKMPFLSGNYESAVIVNGQALGYAVTTRVESAAEKVTIEKAQKAAGQKAQVVVMPSVALGGNTSGKTESLGTRNFEGVDAEGTRTVTTIPAGTIGNERDIEIVYERWYSKDLQLIVYSRHSDPRFGEQIYRLTNISRSEPDRSLFTIPTDFKIAAEPTFNVVTTTKP